MLRPTRSALLVFLVVMVAGCGAAKLSSNADVRRISPRDAFAAARNGEGVIYDVRVRGAFEAQHAFGAEALPEDELDLLFELLPAEGKIILYCT